jgi:anti-anti-sigma factor
MTSAGATARHAGSHPRTGLAADRTIVRLGGALDFTAAPALRERLIGVLHPGTRLLILDLSRVSSCDPAGLAVLIGTQRRARLLGIVVRLVAPSLPVAKLLRLTGLTAASPSVPISPPRSPGNGTSPRTRSQPRESWPSRQGHLAEARCNTQASKKLAQAAAVMAAHSAALQLRLRQTVVEVAAEKNSTLVMPVPVELLRFIDRASRAPGTAHVPLGRTRRCRTVIWSGFAAGSG